MYMYVYKYSAYLFETVKDNNSTDGNIYNSIRDKPFYKFQLNIDTNDVPEILMPWQRKTKHKISILILKTIWSKTSEYLSLLFMTYYI